MLLLCNLLVSLIGVTCCGCGGDHSLPPPPPPISSELYRILFTVVINKNWQIVKHEILTIVKHACNYSTCYVLFIIICTVIRQLVLVDFFSNKLVRGMSDRFKLHTPNNLSVKKNTISRLLFWNTLVLKWEAQLYFLKFYLSLLFSFCHPVTFWISICMLQLFIGFFIQTIYALIG